MPYTTSEESGEGRSEYVPAAAGPFVPETYREGGKVVLPVTFLDGATAELVYDPRLRLAERGVWAMFAVSPADGPGRGFIAVQGDIGRWIAGDAPADVLQGADDAVVRVWTTPDGEPLPRDIAAEKRDSARFADAWRKGGAPVYSTPAYDPELRLLYAATGEPSWSYGTLPPGDNLYSTALVAIDIDDGTLAWYYQMVPHNIWNFDAASPPVPMKSTAASRLRRRRSWGRSRAPESNSMTTGSVVITS